MYTKYVSVRLSLKYSKTLIGETMKDTSPTNNVIPAGRGIVLDSRGASLSMGTDWYKSL